LKKPIQQLIIITISGQPWLNQYETNLLHHLIKSFPTVPGVQQEVPGFGRSQDNQELSHWG